jgi:hypothetical protein
VSSDSCGICGGDGRIANSFGLTTTCPGCHGSGRRSADASLFRDVTKTKASHHRQSNKAAVVVKQTWPTTFEGAGLAKQVQEAPSCSDETKARLIREIIEYEESHGRCTETFVKKVRKQLR